jgi:hypothetical protein
MAFVSVPGLVKDVLIKSSIRRWMSPKKKA